MNDIDIAKLKKLTQAVEEASVNRVEIIDWSIPVEDGGGRVYVKWEKELDVEIQFQDGGRTLKIFIHKNI